MYPSIPKDLRYMYMGDNVTREELNYTLVELHMLTIVFIAIIMIVGIVGNILSIYVFTTRYESSTHRYFILWMAWIDLVSCAVGKPLLLVSMLNPYMFPSESVCKIGRFLHILLVVTSGIIVVAIATERHRRICSPFSPEVSSKRTLVKCIIASIIGFLFAIPALVVYGQTEVKTGVQNITGTECFVIGKYKDTVWPGVYFCAQLLLAFGCLIVIGILYSRTGCTLWWHLRFRKRHAYMPHKPNKEEKAKAASTDKDKKQMDTLQVAQDVCHSISTRSDGTVILNHSDLELDTPYIDPESPDRLAKLEYPNNTPKSNTETPDNKNDSEKLDSTEYTTASEGLQSNAGGLDIPRPELKVSFHEPEIENGLRKSEGRSNLFVTESEAEREEYNPGDVQTHFSRKDNSSVRLKRQSTKHRIESSKDNGKDSDSSLATKQVTMMFFLITLVFVISFIPHLTILLYVVVFPEVLADMSSIGIILYTLCLRSFVINNAANPIIYAFCDRRFRSECADAMVTVITCGRCTYLERE